MTIDQKVQEFVDLTISHHDSIYEGNRKQERRIHSSLEKCICEIKQYPQWQKSILKLLSHNNNSVRIKAASMLLPYKTQKAIHVLWLCSLKAGIDGLNAQMILREWKAGRLKFPEFEDGKIVYR